MKKTLLFLISIFLIQGINATIVPISLEDRVEKSTIIALVELQETDAYWDKRHTRIFTTNILKVKAYLKGYSNESEIAMITDGGIVEGDMQITYPSLKLRKNKEYLVFLQAENPDLVNPYFRQIKPRMLQCQPYGIVQGSIVYEKNKYIDLLVEEPQIESVLFTKINKLSQGEGAMRPNGTPYSIRGEANILPSTNAAVTISSVAKNGGTLSTNFVSGTILEAEQMIITGTGFEATRGSGSVSFAFADDGGGSSFAIFENSDYVSWTDTEIIVKLPSEAGTGNITVTTDGGMSGSSPVTVDFAINNVYNDFFGFPEVTGQRLEFLDVNSSGGYTWEFNNTFLANVPAMESFFRALSNWRCSTGINFDVDDTGTAATFGQDGINLVSFDATAGALGIATSWFTATGGGTCTEFNTLWYFLETDIRVVNPPTSTTTWNYGPAPSVPFDLTFDFESVMLHELGHAHGLGHIIDDAQTMDWNIANGQDRRILSTDEINAGLHKVGHSQMTNCLNPFDPMGAITGPCVVTFSGGLPIELMGFEAILVKDKVKLNWATISEKNNDIFTIERSTNIQEWEIVDRVAGAGNSQSRINYATVDESPLPGKSYYRLKQTDFDGAFTYSNIEAVNIEITKEIRIQPNPVQSNQLNVLFTLNKDTKVEANIYSMAGQLLKRNTFSVVKGINTLQMDLSTMSKGVYFLETIQDGEREMQRFVIGE